MLFSKSSPYIAFTSTNKLLFAVVPSPNWPWLLFPTEYTLLFSSSIYVVYPAVPISSIFPISPLDFLVICTGCFLLVLVPSPNCP